MNETLYTIGKFAKKTGVTVRTLRYYDQQEMIKPSFVSESGRRYYKDEDLVVLQQILSLKFLDFSLQQIRELLAAADGDLTSSLKMQKELMIQKQNHLNRVILSLDHAIGIFETEKRPNLQILSFVIDSIQNEEGHMDWVKQNFPERYAKRVESITGDEWMELHKKTALLFQEMKEALKTWKPESPQVQRLVGECLDMLAGILGEQDILTDMISLDLDWEGIGEKAEQDLFSVSPFTRQEEKLIEKAFEHYYIGRGIQSHD
ncbi:MerR family transcriptional regulator [Metabacillus sp. KIGAM252]|uniref:MerR family transcriptional regulator n=1 Tax=Metabacillus flavus TaxID=2823519 RepID=A0ABS5LAP5_9BACI|nr:MerR family transcriptional regulator [Metabacillus flavus]MBS2967709.1 MerR family transcriptional regulator [Metabacillus flavus]